MQTAAKKPGFAQLDKLDEPAQLSEALARRSLNALAVTSSIVNALVQCPGPRSDQDAMVRAARSMMEQADDMAQRLVGRLGLESVSGARQRVMRLTTEAVAMRWVTTARGQEGPNPDVSSFLPVWRELAKTQDLPALHIPQLPEDERVLLQLSVLDAVQPVMQEIGLFDLFHSPGKAASHARDLIMQAANDAVEQVLPPDASPRAKGQLFQGLMRHAGLVYASNWRTYAEEVIEQLSALPVAQQEQAVARHPDGWPLEPVDQGFQSTFAKLVDMVRYLAAAPAAKPAATVPAQHVDAAAPEPEQSPLPASPPAASTHPAEPISISAATAAAASRAVADDGLDEEDEPHWDDEGPLPPDDEAFQALALMEDGVWPQPTPAAADRGR